MALTKVEEYLFCGNRAHLLANLAFKRNAVTLTLIPVEKEGIGHGKTTATFFDATVPSIGKDPTESDEWPLDIVGFDCYSQGNRWKFVLNCGTTEWIWESNWPVLGSELPD